MTTPRRRRWYDRINWILIGAVLYCVMVWTFILRQAFT